MAALQNIRSKGSLLVIVIGLALFAFIAGDAWKVLQPYQSQDVGEVSGETISAQDFQALVEEYTEVMESSGGINVLSDEQTNRIKDEVWRTYVNNKLIENEVERLGLAISKTEPQAIIDVGAYPMLQQIPLRNPQAGAFDKGMLKKFPVGYFKMNETQMPAQYAECYEFMYNFWAFAEKPLIRAHLQEKYQALIIKSLFSNPVEVEDAFSTRIDQSDLLLAVAPYSSTVGFIIVIRGSGLKEAYDKKEKQFRQYVETRNIEYIDVQVTTSPEDETDTQKKAEKYTAQLGETSSDCANFIRSTSSTQQCTDLYYTDKALPADVIARLDSVKVSEAYDPYYNTSNNTINSFKKLVTAAMADSTQFRQIQIAAGDDAKTKTSADSVYNVIRGGADFAGIAKKYGQAGRPIWISSTNYEGAQINGDDSKYTAAAASLGQNELANLALGRADVILQVMSKKAAKDRHRVAVIKHPVEFNRETYNRAYNDFSRSTTANNILEKLAANAEDAGYRLLDRIDLYSLERTIDGVKGTKEALRWVFTAKADGVSGSHGRGENDYMMVVAVTGIAPEGYRPLSTVEEQLRGEIPRDKKAKKIMADMKAADATSFDQYKNIASAVSDSVKHITFAALAYVPVLRSSGPLIGACASTAELSKLSAPIRGNGDAFILQPYAKEKLSETHDQKAEETILESVHTRMIRQFINDLYLKARIKDSRYLYF